MLMFQLQQFFWLDLWPMLVGFATIFCYQINTRIAVSGARSKTLVFVMSSTASMVTLFGWVTIVRSTQMIPLYGCGVGLASVLVAQIYAVTLPRHRRLNIPVPKVVWRGDHAGVRRFQESLRQSSSGLPKIEGKKLLCFSQRRKGRKVHLQHLVHRLPIPAQNDFLAFNQNRTSNQVGIF